MASDLLENYSLFIFIVYFLLRLLGPLLNWHTHLQLKKKISFFNVLHLVTYMLLGYVIYDFVYTWTLPSGERYDYVVRTFSEENIFSFSHPVIQLLHIGQAIFMIFRAKASSNPSSELYFTRIILITTAAILIVLQLGYVFLNRLNVELVLAPILFLVIFSVILFVSIRYSSIHNNHVNLSTEHRKRIAQLSERENQVLGLIAEGKTDKEISSEIHLSANTVRTYIQRIYSKLELKNRTEAANFYNKFS